MILMGISLLGLIIGGVWYLVAEEPYSSTRSEITSTQNTTPTIPQPRIVPNQSTQHRGTTGIRIEGGKDNTVQDNTIIGADTGIDASGSKSTTISGNKIINPDKNKNEK